MNLKSIKIKGLQLIKSANASFDKINIVSGINKDSPNESGNGSGKTTFVSRALLFGLYNYIEEGLTLKDLISNNEKEASVEIEIQKGNDTFLIVRKIPAELKIFLNGTEVQANTSTIKQQFITDQLEDKDFFRSYRCVDDVNGINILDLGITSLRKTLMSFIEDVFTQKRQNLLNQKAEREKYSVDKKLYKHYLSERRKNILECSLTEIKNEIVNIKNQIREVQKTISNVNSEVKYRDKTIAQKFSETDKLKNGFCPILQAQCETLKNKYTEVKKNQDIEVAKLKDEITAISANSTDDQDYLADLERQLEEIDNKRIKIDHNLLRLKESFRLSEYKYTKADIVVYDEAIKQIDMFAGEYIKEWLGSLQVIVNNLLKSVNISVEFTAEKDFLKVYDNGQLYKYEALSKGQKCFLSVIFKLVILMQQNKTGLVIMDDGLNDIDKANFIPLINIIKTLPFQIVAVYQAYDDELNDVKHFKVIRQNGESNVQEA